MMPLDPETELRLKAAGMTWDETRQDWIPDPAIWGGDEPAPGHT